MSIMQIDKFKDRKIFCSVVMPVHNGERFLREAIEGVLTQTYSNFEFLIIENCSTDSSVEIIKSYKDPRIRLIIENNCGQVQAYNRGFKEAKGEFIFIHDQDDISHHERFQEQLEFMNSNIDICGSYFNLINEDGVKVGQMETPINHNNIINELLYKNSAIFNSSVCIRKKVFEILGYFDASYYPSADYEFYLRGINQFNYANVPMYLYSWRQHQNQISKSLSKDIIKKTISISLKNKVCFPIEMENTYTGLVYYYNDKLLQALRCFLIAILKDKHTKTLLRYFFITLILGIPLKVFRKNNFLNSTMFDYSKKIVDKLFR